MSNNLRRDGSWEQIDQFSISVAILDDISIRSPRKTILFVVEVNKLCKYPKCILCNFEYKITAVHLVSFDLNERQTEAADQCFCFQNFIGYFDPETYFLDSENKYFWGELTDISAKKEALLQTLVIQKGETTNPHYIAICSTQDKSVAPKSIRYIKASLQQSWL